MLPLPFLTKDLPATGGQLRSEPSDFWVGEIPAYEASGQGDHLLCRIEKRGITTFEAVRRLAEVVGVPTSEVGSAGLKDKNAVTEQQISVPARVEPQVLLDHESEGLRVLHAAHHGNKLRTGHLRGNKFRLVIRGGTSDALARASAIVTELARAPGSPNWFGHQRFGRDRDNAAQGLAILTGKSRGPRGRKRRLLISAFQSQLFNEYLVARIEAGLFRQMVSGDLAQIRGHQKSFHVQDVELENKRLESGETVITGPMYGHKMMCPNPETQAAALEADILGRYQLSLDSFRPLGKLATGTRRSLAIDMSTARCSDHDGHLLVEFELPPGSYATAITRELLKSDDGERS